MIFWTGNSAKARILSEILEANPSAKVFDFGCGDGGDWRPVLESFPKLELTGYEPHFPSAVRARERLKGLQARIYSGPLVEMPSLAADFIVSFSVFEHVFDRKAYVLHAKKCLGPGGVFYLNYDDGHFRNFLDLNRAQDWRPALVEWIHNRLAGPRSWFGRLSKYQRRVTEAEAETLVKGAGFQIASDRYENIISFKSLSRFVSDKKKQAFTDFWIEIEKRLNEEFVEDSGPWLGHSKNLWHVMSSRTLSLRHA